MLEAILNFFRQLFVFTGYVGTKNGFPPPLSAEEEAVLADRMQQGDDSARDKLIEHNLRLVAHIAKKYAMRGRDTDDLISIGSIGLIKAVNTYSRSRGKSLAAYAGRCIENEILMSIRAERKHKGEVSLNEPIGVDRDGNEITMGDILGTDGDPVMGEVLTRTGAEKLRAVIDGLLNERERLVILLRYGIDGGEPLPQKDVGKLLGISRSYVSRIEKKAIEKLSMSLAPKSYY